MSADLRLGRGDVLRRRRRVGAMALSAIGSMGVVSAYQFGLLRHLPRPPVGPFDADARLRWSGVRRSEEAR